MTVIAVLGVVTGLLFAYQDQGWRLFYQSYSRGLSQTKAKLALRILTEDLREANKRRVSIGKGVTYGVPFPDDATANSSYIYFTKPIIFEPTGDITGYDYTLYYFAKPKTLMTEEFRIRDDEVKITVLKSIRFLNQSKFYTEDSEKSWPFMPPLYELFKSRLPEDDNFLESLKQDMGTEDISEESIESSSTSQEEEFLDHFAQIKKESRNIPISGNFDAVELTDPFSTEEVSIFFGQSYKQDQPINIAVAIEEPAGFFGLMGAKSQFEVKITPRN
ncbi:MAG: hypothetical protein HYR97_08445 [Candidatus Melainabacteria bacterium]|nr:hypothetical protein [Candidatus Melainabacteria bacterium]MBI3308241.1 hypothetical protein [Candidatus Melainabacteria bacterium]